MYCEVDFSRVHDYKSYLFCSKFYNAYNISYCIMRLYAIPKKPFHSLQFSEQLFIINKPLGFFLFKKNFFFLISAIGIVVVLVIVF